MHKTFSTHDTCRCKWLFKKKKPSQNDIKATITDTCFLFETHLLTQVEFLQSLSGVYIFFLRPFYNHLNPRSLTKIITIILTIYCSTWAHDLRQHESNFLDPEKSKACLICVWRIAINRRRKRTRHFAESMNVLKIWMHWKLDEISLR